MQYLARFGVGGLIDVGRLVGRQTRENSPRNLGVDPQALQRRDQPVASEQGAEPRHARVGVRPGVRVRDQQVQVGERSLHPRVEPAVAALDSNRAFPLALQHARYRRLRAVEALDHRRLGTDLTAHRQIQGSRLPGAEIEVPSRVRPGELGRTGREVQPRAAGDAVEADVAERDGRALDERIHRVAAPRALEPAHLEDVVEVGREPYAYDGRPALRRVVAQLQAFVAGARAQELRPEQVNRLARHVEMMLAVDVGVRHVDDEQRVALPDAGAQQHRSQAIALDLQAAEKPRPLVEETLFSKTGGPDVAGPVEHGECIGLLQDPGEIVGVRRGPEDVVAADLNGLLHEHTVHSTPSHAATGGRPGLRRDSRAGSARPINRTYRRS